MKTLKTLLIVLVAVAFSVNINAQTCDGTSISVDENSFPQTCISTAPDDGVNSSETFMVDADGDMTNDLMVTMTATCAPAANDADGNVTSVAACLGPDGLTTSSANPNTDPFTLNAAGGSDMGYVSINDDPCASCIVEVCYDLIGGFTSDANGLDIDWSSMNGGLEGQESFVGWIEGTNNTTGAAITGYNSGVLVDGSYCFAQTSTGSTASQHLAGVGTGALPAGVFGADEITGSPTNTVTTCADDWGEGAGEPLNGDSGPNSTVGTGQADGVIPPNWGFGTDDITVTRVCMVYFGSNNNSEDCGADDVSEVNTSPSGSFSSVTFCLPPVEVECGACTEGSAGLVITELSYDPATSQGNDGDCEYIELFNSYSNAITLDANTTLELSNGASFTFPAGTTIAPGEYIIIAINPTGFGTCTWATPPPAGTQIFGPTSGSLSNSGESVDITLACASNPAVDFTQSVAFSDGATPTAGGQGDAVYYPLDGTGPLAGAPTPGSGDCAGCAMTEFLCETVACAIEADLMAAPAPPTVTESTCQADGTTVDGGVIDPITCPAGATAEYSTDGGATWAATVPAYDQTTAITVTVRCLCDEDMTTASPTAEVITVPGMCVSTCAVEADLMAAPAPPTVTESTCQADGTTVDGGVIDPITCPVGATAEYSTDGGTTWAATVPTYDQTNPITVTVRCLCDEDMMTASPTAEVATVPGMCMSPVCEITDLVVTPTACDPADDTYDLDIGFTVTDPGPSGMFNVDVCGTAFGPFSYAADVPLNIPNLPADGTMACTVTVTDVDNAGGTVTPAMALYVSFVPDGTGAGGGIDECATESVTIHNFSTDAAGCVDVDISGYQLEDNVGVFYTFPAGTIVPAGGSLTITIDQINTCSGTVGAGDGGGSQFGNGADNVNLLDPASAVIDMSGTVDGSPGEEFESPALTAAGGAGSAVCTADACSAAMDYDAPVSCLAPAECTLVLSPETVVCDAETAGTDTYTVSIPFDNGTEGTPGSGGYTVVTSGTLGGDNPMVVQMGTITITFTEGAPYDYSITGIAGTGANELCDFAISGASPMCDPAPACTLVLSPEMVVCDAQTAGADTYTVSIPFDNGTEGTPGSGGYTVVTSGTLGGDNPMVVQMGTITITFTEGAPYDYSITGIAGTGANELCDFAISGASPMCDPAPACTLVLSPEMVVCDAQTAGADTYTVSIPFDNGSEGTPGSGGYTVVTSGTLGGDNPMVVQMGTITITFTEGAPYDYSITGIAGTGANELCDFAISGASPMCDPAPACTLVLSPETVVCDAETAGTDTYTVSIPFDNGAEATPGPGGYTVVTSGTLGGDNPMVVQMGTITITFTEGAPYDYSITGIAGTGANELCDFAISGAGLDCTPMVCEDEIAGLVIADPSCDLTGITVTVTDDMGNTFTFITDAAGIYDSSPMVFPCGNYTAALTGGVPACYTGDVGPRAFVIDGDTAMNDSDGVDFGGIADIPTVGEWGLIILALLMSIVAVVGIRERKASEINV